MTERDYQHTLADLSRYLVVVEQQMSSQTWDGIDYQRVPSRANLIYNDAFLRHDTERRREFLERVESGDAKINAGTLFPHDIMKKQPMKKYVKETGRFPITATMAVESISREVVWMRQGCNAFNNKSPISQPMSFWTENDVLEYLYTYQIPYASVYGEIVKADGGGGRQQESIVLAVSFVPLALIWKSLRTASSV